MTKKTRIILTLSIVSTLIIVDQWTKYLAVKHLTPHESIIYLGGYFKLILTRNFGAWGSLGANWTEPLKSMVLIYLPGLFLLGLISLTLFKKGLTNLEILSFSFISAGGLANLIDRVKEGAVVDMFWMGISEYRYLQTNIFNIADIVIMVGAGFMILNQIKLMKKAKQTT